MYHGTETPRVARRQTEAPAVRDPDEVAARALERVRKALTAFRPGMPLNSASLRAALTVTFPKADAEAERLFALGWLCWLDGAFADAEPLFTNAVELARETTAADRLAEAAYWLARVRIRLDRPDAVVGFETLLRQLGGSPQATAWFIDLLWRCGRIERAEQVWQAVRGNKRVAACPEGPLLEARSLLRRGDFGGGIKALVEHQPTNGVVWVERLLLLTWAEAAQGRRDRAQEFLRRADHLPYPRTALDVWRSAVTPDKGAEDDCSLSLSPCLPVSLSPVPTALHQLDRGHRALGEGRTSEAVEAFRAAQAQPFARYALARLGQDDFAAILAAHPGPFLAVRCRVWLALERFRQRHCTPGEWLETLQRESRLGFVVGPAVAHYRALATILSEQHTAAQLNQLFEEGDGADPAERRNLVRVCLEAVQRWPAAEGNRLLEAWSRSPRLAAEDDLRRVIDRVRLHLELRHSDVDGEVSALLSREPSLQPGADLWQATTAITPDESWRDRVRGLGAEARWRPLAQALLVVEAAQRGDATTAATLLDDADAWRGFRPGPPEFVLRSLASLAASQPAHAVFRRAVTRWIANWSAPALGRYGAIVAVAVGVVGAGASIADAPPGVPLAPWFLHQAARAVGRGDFAEALACVRRAEAADPDWATVPNAAVVRDALPGLERHAAAQALGAALAEAGASPVPSRLLTDLVDLLRLNPDGAAIVDAALRGEHDTVRERLKDIAVWPHLPPRLAHHLALLAMHSARALDDADDSEAAESHWQRSWSAWLRFLAAAPDRDGPPSRTAAGLVLDALLAYHRQRTGELLARNAVAAARRHWSIVQSLPGLAAQRSDPLAAEVAARVERFRDELASDYLVATREAMRYGAIPEGWHADYDKGLTHLRRLLSLDPQNARLLTALVEICGDWFLDLYNTDDRARLTEQAGRFAPFAQQLARLVENRAGELAARAALSEFLKFRGFVAAERSDRVAFYREALRLNPGNENVRDLLRGLGESVES